jgi:hypothetical protein
VNADRAARHEAEMRRKVRMAAIEVEQGRTKESRAPSSSATKGTRDHVGSPSSEVGQDPAPTRHEPETERERVLAKSKYEAAEPFHPPKGNRFS